MKITLVSIHPHPSPQAVPLACAFLKEALLADPDLSGVLQVDLAEFFLQDAPAACAEALSATPPDLVGFSVYVWNRDHALAIARELKRKRPEVRLCAGGPEATANPGALLESGAFDVVIAGEGEGSFTEVVRRTRGGVPVTGVAGVVLPGAAGCALPAPVDLAALPSPYLSGSLDPGATGGVLWQLSRGCDFACSFCFDHKGTGGVRRFPLARVEEELRLFARRGVPQVFVLDSTFNKIPERAKQILRLIRKLAPGVHFHFEVRSEFIDPEMAELFASITCSLQIGLQSADRAVLRSVGRGFDPDDFSYRISLLNECGAIFGFDLIYGLPGDRLSTFRSSLDFALSLYPNHLDIFPLAVLPGTRLHRKAQELQVEHLATPPYTLQATPSFPPQDLAFARSLATACDLFYTRGKAVAWFHAVRGAVKMSSSSLLHGFADFLKKRGISAEEEIAESEIPSLQRGFLSEIFKSRKKERLLPLALDLVDYHHHYAGALLTPPAPVLSPKQVKKLDLLATRFVLSPSATLATFSYEILDVLEAGDVDLASFASRFRPSQSYAIIYPAGGEVRTESVARPYYLLLERAHGKESAKELCRKLSISFHDALPFLQFALLEGILVPA